MEKFNYRIIETKTGPLQAYILGIHMVFYDKNNEPVSWTEDPIIIAESLEELQKKHDRIGQAFNKPILKDET